MDSGLTYSDDKSYRRDVVSMSTNSNAGFIDEIRWEDAVNNNFTLVFFSCSSSDDEKAVLQTIVDANPQISGVTSYGRDYNGYWGGSSHLGSDIYAERGRTSLGYIKYGQNENNNVVQMQYFPHPASKFLKNRNPTNRTNFIKELNSSNYFLGNNLKNSPFYNDISRGANQ